MLLYLYAAIIADIQHITCALAEHTLQHALILAQQAVRHKGLNGARKTAALQAPGALPGPARAG